MPPVKHAVLSASSAARWLNCPPSARLSENYEEKYSEYAQEGTDAHALCEYYLLKALGRETENPIENLTYFNAEMDNHANDYAAYVMEIMEEAKKFCADPIVFVEQTVDFSKYVPEGFGTADTVIIADKRMYICDFKYGMGVTVSSEDNPQLKLYALGALEKFGDIYDIEEVELIIYQPRLGNISNFVVSVKDLYSWADETLMPTAALAFEGNGEYKCGTWCKFCKAKNECRERAKANLELAKYDFAQPPVLTDEEIEYILPKLEDLISWAEDIKKYMEDARG